MYRSTYIHYEETTRKFYELDKLQLLADLYQVDIECLLNEYMLFLYRGQGKLLKALRNKLHVNQSTLAKLIGVPLGTVKQWERDRCAMMYASYAKVQKLIQDTENRDL